MESVKKGVRAVLVVPAALALLAGLDGALLLLGLPALVSTDRLPQIHGPLLVLGFVGTVIALERAVALRQPWGYSAPGLLGLGAVLLVTPAPVPLGQALLVAGTAAQLALYAALWRRQESGALALQVLGAVMAAGSALLWWGGTPVHVLLGWFTAFLVLTITGERVELARVGGLTARAESQIGLLGLAVATGAVAATLWPVGHVLLGAAIVTLVAVLVNHDVARRTVRTTGLARYMAWCLLAGYAWLALAGAVWLVRGEVAEGPGYDAVTHAVFLGFTLSMILAHAPVILPAVLGRPLPYHPAMYGPVALLHASLALRVVVGDLDGHAWALELGGGLNVASVLLAIGVGAWSANRARGVTRRVDADPVDRPQVALADVGAHR